MPTSTTTPSATKALEITAAFEGCSWGGLTGNFDGQGFSAFIISWALGQGTLQGVIKTMHAQGPQTFARCCTQPVAQYNNKVIDLSQELLHVCDLPIASAVAWARQRQDARYVPFAHWRAAFKALGDEPGFRKVQVSEAGAYLQAARSIMASLGFQSERALALCFDIAVQCGSLSEGTRSRYAAATDGGMTEPQKLVALAYAVAPQGGVWHADVQARKLCIARGSGIVHGAYYNLASEYGLGDGPVVG